MKVDKLSLTVALLKSLRKAVELYRAMRRELYVEKVKLQLRTEERVMEYFREVEFA